MINIKVSRKNTTDDYIAVERETGAVVLPGRHVFGIFSVGIISILLALPFGQLVPNDYSPFSVLEARGNQQKAEIEKLYLTSNEKEAEENLEISSTAGSEENYDDDIASETLLAEEISLSQIPEDIRSHITASDADKQREKFVPSALPSETASAKDNAQTSPSQVIAHNSGDNKDNSSADEKSNAENSAVTASTVSTSQDKEITPAEKFISSIISPNSVSTVITKNSEELLSQTKELSKLDATWYEQTVRRGDSLSKIFSYLNLSSDTLKKIIAKSTERELNLVVDQKIQFLIDKENNILEIAIPYTETKQVRFSYDPVKQSYIKTNEDRNAQFADNAQSIKMLDAQLMPSYIELQRIIKKRDEEKAEKELLAKREAELKAKEARERRELAKLEALKKEKEEKLLAKEKEKEQRVDPAVRPRLILGQLKAKESFDKAAKRMGLTSSEITTIKNQYRGKINFAKLSEGDSFRILFNGIGEGSSMTAMSMKTKKYGEISLFRHPQNHIFYEENGYTPTVGEFRRFPLMGQIKVNSPFNLNRYHPIKKRIRPHYGVDFKVSIGTPVYAPSDGVVTYASFMRGGGYTIILTHANGYSTVYMHLSKFDVRKGDKVYLGQVIGKSGNTGYSTGPHLHYEVHVNGRAVDPLKVDLPSGNPASAQKLKEIFQNTVYILKTELNKNSLAVVK